MTILVLKLPDFKKKDEERPRECTYCGGETFQRWGRAKKAAMSSAKRASCSPPALSLPPEGDRRLYALWKQVAVSGRKENPLTPLDQLRDILIRLSENWESFCAFYTDPAIPWTNNGTEQVISRMKMCTRTVRGYKTWPDMQTGLMLAATKLV